MLHSDLGLFLLSAPKSRQSNPCQHWLRTMLLKTPQSALKIRDTSLAWLCQPELGITEGVTSQGAGSAALQAPRSLSPPCVCVASHWGGATATRGSLLTCASCASHARVSEKYKPGGRTRGFASCPLLGAAASRGAPVGAGSACQPVGGARGVALRAPKGLVRDFPPAGVGSLLARFQLSEGPSAPAPLAVQFTSEGSTLSSCDIELVGAGYRFSLIKKRFAAGRCQPAALPRGGRRAEAPWRETPCEIPQISPPWDPHGGAVSARAALALRLCTGSARCSRPAAPWGGRLTSGPISR